MASAELSTSTAALAVVPFCREGLLCVSSLSQTHLSLLPAPVLCPQGSGPSVPAVHRLPLIQQSSGSGSTCATVRARSALKPPCALTKCKYRHTEQEICGPSGICALRLNSTNRASRDLFFFF